MRVAFWLLQDSIQQWSNWIAGLHYVQHCLEALATLNELEVPEVVAFLPASLVEKFNESPICRSAAWLKVVPIDEQMLGDQAGLAKLESLVANYRCDLFFPVMTPPIIPVSGKIVAWIADYQHRHCPEFFNADDLAYRDKLFSFLTCIADRIVCSSETVQSDLERFYPLAKNRSFVLRFTVQPPAKALTGNIASTLEKYGIDQPYAYLPYQFWSHKNHRVVFQAWQQLRERGESYSLICSGGKNDARNPDHFPSLEAFLKKHQLEDSIRILGIVDRHDQWQLYRGARLILQPSLFEGWSTSVEEARCLGKPIILSDIPVHREQLADRGHFFPPHDPDCLATLVQQLWNELPSLVATSHEREALEAHHGRIEAFGKQLLELFNDVVSEQREPIASQVLPLFTFFQHEAKARLAVIEELSTRLHSASPKGNERKHLGSAGIPAAASLAAGKSFTQTRAWLAKVFHRNID